MQNPILLSPVAPSAYADCRRQSSNMLNFQGQRRPAQAFQPITKALQGHSEGRRGVLHGDVYGRIPTLYFYPRRNLRYAVATRRQPQAWRSAPRDSSPKCGWRHENDFSRRPSVTLWRFRDWLECLRWSALALKVQHGWTLTATVDAYALGAIGDRSINSCADSPRMRAYTRAWSINPALCKLTKFPRNPHMLTMPFHGTLFFSLEVHSVWQTFSAGSDENCIRMTTFPFRRVCIIYMYV